MAKSTSERIIATPSSYAKEHYLYVQEVGTLQSLEPHVSQRQNLSSCLFFIVLNGSGYVSYDGNRFTITAGDCVWLDCTKPYSHESSANDPWSLMWVHFYGKEVPYFYSNFLKQSRSFLFHPENTLAFMNILQQIYQIHSSKTSLMELFANRCLTDLITLCFSENQGNQEISSIPEKMKQVSDYLENNYAQKINLEDLSSRFYISKFHLSREYKKIYGVTIGSDLTSKRISHAKSMLRFSDASIENIAFDCGFQNAGYFIKVFKKYENMTPLEYRRKW
ncbi:MAG: AraC family transcriptional regulator [Lachnospiraceae bacterium]|nr:AraC family transcriptional regulator [Lachnospiraceae bacterium]MDE7284866.1 AraC family transcriptional regulator [Lachnospiraceae bacterium]